MYLLHGNRIKTRTNLVYTIFDAWRYLSWVPFNFRYEGNAFSYVNVDARYIGIDSAVS